MFFMGVVSTLTLFLIGVIFSNTITEKGKEEFIYNLLLFMGYGSITMILGVIFL